MSRPGWDPWGCQLVQTPQPAPPPASLCSPAGQLCPRHGRALSLHLVAGELATASRADVGRHCGIPSVYPQGSPALHGRDRRLGDRGPDPSQVSLPSPTACWRRDETGNGDPGGSPRGQPHQPSSERLLKDHYLFQLESASKLCGKEKEGRCGCVSQTGLFKSQFGK